MKRALRVLRGRTAQGGTGLLVDMLLLFIVGSVIGYVIEMIFCRITRGRFESRKGLVYGPFSQIYGMGAILMTTLLFPLRDNMLAVFIGSAIIGGVFEAVCSYVQEKAFGTVSWEYSQQKFSLFGGRTSLKFMFFWGALGMAYIGLVHPALFGAFGAIPMAVKAPVVAGITAFLIYDIALSCLAVARWQRRRVGAPAKTRLQGWLDEKFGDARMESIYPNMSIAGEKPRAPVPEEVPAD